MDALVDATLPLLLPTVAPTLLNRDCALAQFADRFGAPVGLSEVDRSSPKAQPLGLAQIGTFEREGDWAWSQG
jgi:hypothetical protein